MRDPARRARKLTFHRVDILNTDLAPYLADVDIVVHLAAIVGPIPDEGLMTRVNVDGTRRVLDAAARAGVNRVVRLSSAAVYGAWENNPVPLTEDAVLRPNPGYLPAILDAECERALAEWARPRTIGSRRACASRRSSGAGASSVLAAAATGHPPVAMRSPQRTGAGRARRRRREPRCSLAVEQSISTACTTSPPTDGSATRTPMRSSRAAGSRRCRRKPPNGCCK